MTYVRAIFALDKLQDSENPFAKQLFSIVSELVSQRSLPCVALTVSFHYEHLGLDSIFLWLD